MSKSRFARRFLLIVAYTALLLAAGTAAFLQFPGWTISDALHMTWITLTAVGYQEVRPLTDAGRIVAGILLAGGITAMGMWFALITSVIIEMDLAEVFRTRQAMKKISDLSDHVIVCGAGRTGRQVVREMISAEVPYVAIDHDPERLDLVREIDEEAPVLEEDATREQTLEDAGVHRARGLIAALSADTDNLFVCLTARDLRPDLTIVARALNEENMSKLFKAGADHCVSPNVTGGARMASMLLQPQVMSFLDVVTGGLAGGEELSLRLEEVVVPEGSSLAGHTLEEAAIPQKTGLIVIAISHREDAEEDREGRLVYNPGPDEEMHAGDALIVLGQSDQVEGLRAIVQP